MTRLKPLGALLLTVAMLSAAPADAQTLQQQMDKARGECSRECGGGQGGCQGATDEGRRCFNNCVTKKNLPSLACPTNQGAAPAPTTPASGQQR